MLLAKAISCGPAELKVSVWNAQATDKGQIMIIIPNIEPYTLLCKHLGPIGGCECYESTRNG